MTEPLQTPKPQVKEAPSVHQSFRSLKKGRQELKVRVIQYRSSGPLLDIREYGVFPHPETGTTESLFTKKGITLSIPQVLQLKEDLDEILEVMLSVRESADS